MINVSRLLRHFILIVAPINIHEFIYNRIPLNTYFTLVKTMVSNDRVWEYNDEIWRWYVHTFGLSVSMKQLLLLTKYLCPRIVE